MSRFRILDRRLPTTAAVVLFAASLLMCGPADASIGAIAPAAGPAIASGAIAPAAGPAIAFPEVSAAGPAIASPEVSAAVILADINAVRAKFGLGPAAATTAYQRAVVAAANQNRDPALVFRPKVVALYGIWGEMSTSGARSSLNPASIVRLWVYEDEWKGGATINGDCTSPRAPGCNGHRRAVLSKPPRPGARLSIDAYGATRSSNGGTTLSVAAVLSWTVR